MQSAMRIIHQIAKADFSADVAVGVFAEQEPNSKLEHHRDYKTMFKNQNRFASHFYPSACWNRQGNKVDGSFNNWNAETNPLKELKNGTFKENRIDLEKDQSRMDSVTCRYWRWYGLPTMRQADAYAWNDYAWAEKAGVNRCNVCS